MPEMPEQLWIGCIGKGIIVSQNPKRGTVKFVPSTPLLEHAGEMWGLLTKLTRISTNPSTNPFGMVALAALVEVEANNLLAKIKAEEGNNDK